MVEAYSLMNNCRVFQPPGHVPVPGLEDLPIGTRNISQTSTFKISSQIYSFINEFI